MKTNKVEKFNINNLSGFSVISEQEQIEMKGGWTLSQAETMMDQHSWNGGMIDGIGYVGACTNIYGSAPIPYLKLNYDHAIGQTYYDGESYDVDDLMNAGKVVYNAGVWVLNRF